MIEWIRSWWTTLRHLYQLGPEGRAILRAPHNPDDFVDAPRPMDEDFWGMERLADEEYASYMCRTCHSHWDNHASAELSCPAYTIKDGSVVFSDVHQYRGPHPRRLA